jgi:putative ATP-binding cassette transporter
MSTNTTTGFLRDFAMLAKPYWFSEEKWSARGLLLLIVSLNLGLVYVSIEINRWNNLFFNSIQDRDFNEFTRQIGRFCALAGAYVLIAVYQIYLKQMLEIRWRRWLTDWYLKRWLSEYSYYRLQLRSGEADNPDQRIAEDLRFFVANTLDLSLGLLASTMTVICFATILWGLSGILSFSVGQTNFSIPGYLVWIALAYSFLGTLFTYRIGRPLVRLFYDQQRFEANFRFSLVRFRENAEAIALYRGEEEEVRSFRERFTALARNWRGLMERQRKLSFFTQSFYQLAIVFPILAASPRYFAGAIPLGGLTQTAAAFTTVQGAMSWFVEAYGHLAEWKATIDRLIGFHAAIETARKLRSERDINVILGTQPDLVMEDLDLALPDGRTLVAGASMRIKPGDSVLLTGLPGSGKSTLFRALAEIWPFGRGNINKPAACRMLFIPQRPYVPVGRLRDAVTYPGLGGTFSDTEVQEALSVCGLSYLCGRLEQPNNWGLQLSPGEQQRLAFARALLLKPSWLFLDEATSALDEASEARFYQLVKERLPGVTIFSISHRPTVAAFHDRQVGVRRDVHGLGLMVDLSAEAQPIPRVPAASPATATAAVAAAAAT